MTKLYGPIYAIACTVHSDSSVEGVAVGLGFLS